MKIITATRQTQGERSNDYDFCIDGELVMLPPVICDRDADDADGGCGCGRGWAGLNSHRATTTAVVVDLAMSFDDYTEAIRSSLGQQGWPDVEAAAVAVELADLASHYPSGTVLGHRLGDLYARGNHDSDAERR
jgi:hypothetical protein